MTDFIYALVVEELGIIGGIILILLYSVVIYIGYKLSISCKDKFAQYLSFGITSSLMVQVFTNIAVVIGLLPVTGITLPLMSYGGSSLIISMFMMGIINNIIKTADKNLTFIRRKKVKQKLHSN